MPQWRKLIVVPALLATLPLAACAGASRPSVEELKSALTSAMPELSSLGGDAATRDALIDCVATKLHASDEISDKTLSSMVDAAKAGETDVAYASEEEKTKAESEMENIGTTCAEEALSGTAPTAG